MKKLLIIFSLAILTGLVSAQTGTGWASSRTKVNFLDSTRFWKAMIFKGATSGYTTIKSYDIAGGEIYVATSANKDTLAFLKDVRAGIGEGSGVGYPESGIVVSTSTGWGASITDNSANWNTAYADRLKWDGGSTGLVAATGRTSLGATTVGSNLFTLPNPGAVTFLRFNADNSLSTRSVANFKTDLSLNNVTNESKATMFASPTFTGTVTIPTPFTLGSTSVTTTGAQLNYLNIAAGTTGTGNIVLSISPTLTGHPTFEGVTSTGATGTGNMVYSISPELTGDVVLPTTTSIGTVTDTEIGYIDGVTSAIQDQIDTKAPIHDAGLTGTTDIAKLQVGNASSNTKAEIDSMSFVGDEIADFVGSDTTKRYIPYADRTNLTDITGVTWMYFKVDSTAYAPEDGDSIFTDSRFIGKEVEFWRTQDTASGLKLQIEQNWADGVTYGYEFDDETGKFTTHPPLISKERIRIEAYNPDNWTEITPTLQFCDAYQTVHDAFDTKPSEATSLIWDPMVKALVDGGYWDGPNVKMDAFYFFAAHEQADESLINWVNPGTFDATLSGLDADDWVQWQGYTGDGVGHILLNYNPTDDATNYAQNDASMMVYIRTDLSEDVAYYVFANSEYEGVETTLVPYNGTNAQWRINCAHTDYENSITTTSQGFWAVTRTGSTASALYQNGSLLETNDVSSTGVPNEDIRLLHIYGKDGSSHQVSVFIISSGMDGTAAGNINTIIETAMDALGTGVE